MHRPTRALRLRPVAWLCELDLPSLLASPMLASWPILLSSLATLALLGAVASGAIARPGSPGSPFPQRGRRAGALGAGLTAGTGHRAALDPLALVPSTHFALDLYLARLRQSKTLAPHVAGLEARLARTVDPQGAALLGCAPGLAGRVDRMILSAPLPGLGSRPTQGPVTTTPTPEAAVLILLGRFDAPALARCLAARPRQAGRLGAPAAIALDRGTLLVSTGTLPLARPGGNSTTSRGRASPPPQGSASLRTDSDTALRVRAPSLSLGALRVPAFGELKDVRAAEALVGLPSDHLQLRLVLTLGSAASTSALALKLQQALTLAAFALPTPFGLTRALQSAKVAAQGLTVSLRLLLPPGDFQHLLAEIARRSGAVGSRSITSPPGGPRLAP